MSLQLRYYQREAIDSIYNYLRSNKGVGHPCLALPTGTGKSLIIAQFVTEIISKQPHRKILVVTTSKELVVQDFEELLKINPFVNAGINCSGLNRNDTNPAIIFSTIASIYKKSKEFGKVDIIIVDEAHSISNEENSMYQKFILECIQRNPKLNVIGLTATPYRLGQGMITDCGLFTDICYDITKLEDFNRLISEGFICNLLSRPMSHTYNVDSVHIQCGEFNQKELQKAVNINKLTDEIIKEALNYVEDRSSWLIFASGIEHCENVASCLNFYGIPTTFVHSKMKSKDRDNNIYDFKNGIYTAIVNMNVLTTGFNHKAIDLIIDLQPTTSPGRHIQKYGRGLRTLEGKNNCLILDFAGNIARLGPINDPVIPKKKGESSGIPPIKTCPKCELYNHISAKICTTPNCGHIFEIHTRLESKASHLEVIKTVTKEKIVSEYPVDYCYYSSHKKKDKPPVLKVLYHCGFMVFQEYIPVESFGYPRKRAYDWWSKRTTLNMPGTVAECLELQARLNPPKSITVDTTNKYPIIEGYSYV